MASKYPPVQFRDERLRQALVLRTGREDAPAVNARAKADLNVWYAVIDRLLAQNPLSETDARVLVKEWVANGTTGGICKSLVLTAAYDDACRRFAHGSDYGSAGFRIIP